MGRDRWNYWSMLAEGVCVDIAQNVASPRLVLPFLYLSLGAPVFLAGLLIPLVQVSRLIGQLLSAPFISSARARKWYMGAGAVLIALALAASGLSADISTKALVAAIFLTAVIAIGTGQAVSRLAFQHMLGYMMPHAQRTSLLFTQTAISGVLAIAIAWLLRHVFADAESLQSHLALLWAGVASYLFAALLCSVLQEGSAAPAGEAHANAAGKRENVFSAIRSGARDALTVAWFRRFVVVRLMLQSVELAMPFYAIHAASLHMETHSSLGVFVIGASAGLIVGGPVWQRLSARSLVGVMAAGCALAAAAGVFAVMVDEVALFHHEVYYAAIFFVISSADQAVSTARKVYLVEATSESQRPYYIATAETSVGLVSVGFAFALGVLAHLQHVVWPIYLIIGLNLAALGAVFVLPASGRGQCRAGQRPEAQAEP